MSSEQIRNQHKNTMKGYRRPEGQRAIDQFYNYNEEE